MTTASLSELLSGGTVLAVVASGLLVFVSGCVIYLSSVEWRDRRRRSAQERQTSKRPAASRR